MPLTSRSVKPIDRSAALLLQATVDVDPERPLNVTLQEATKDRRVELKALAARCLAAIGEFEPILRELGDPYQSSYWQGEFDALRHALNRSPETAAKVRETLGLTDRAYIIYSGEVLREGNADDIINDPEVRRLYLGEEFRM